MRTQRDIFMILMLFTEALSTSEVYVSSRSMMWINFYSYLSQSNIMQGQKIMYSYFTLKIHRILIHATGGSEVRYFLYFVSYEYISLSRILNSNKLEFSGLDI
jgi:hypothetical protein